MKTIRFSRFSEPINVAPQVWLVAYGCNQPEDQSGEYVPAAVARELLEALQDNVLVEAEIALNNCSDSATPAAKRELRRLSQRLAMWKSAALAKVIGTEEAN